MYGLAAVSSAGLTTRHHHPPHPPLPPPLPRTGSRCSWSRGVRIHIRQDSRWHHPRTNYCCQNLPKETHKVNKLITKANQRTYSEALQGLEPGTGGLKDMDAFHQATHRPMFLHCESQLEGNVFRLIYLLNCMAPLKTLYVQT